MLARRCGRPPGRASLFTAIHSSRSRGPSRAAALAMSSPSIWITDDLLRREFQSFFLFSRGVSTSQARCEFNSEDYSRRLLRRRMSMTRVDPVRRDQFGVEGCSNWNETPPTFSWSMMEQPPKIGIYSDGSSRTAPILPPPPNQNLLTCPQLQTQGSADRGSGLSRPAQLAFIIKLAILDR